MKPCASRPIVLVAFAILALALPTAFVLRSADSTPARSRLAEDMIGTWVLVGTPGHVGQAPVSGGRLKFRTGRYFTTTQADPRNHIVVVHDGGTYTLNGDEYVESLEYANPTSMNDIGKSFKFTVKVEGDLMTQTGLDNPYTEVWKRLK